jgi:hypothetical protein
MDDQEKQHHPDPVASPGVDPRAAKKKRLRKIIKWSVIGGIWAMVGLQLVPVEGVGVNPPERHQLDAPPEVVSILKRACFDCHSNETEWPIYARLAPGSWLMVYDVKKGRNILNFSEWGDQDADSIAYDKEESWEQIEKGEMPLWYYIYPMHMGAKLSEQDKAVLKAWLLQPQEEDEKEEKEEKEGEKAEEKTAEEAPAEKPAETTAEKAEE